MTLSEMTARSGQHLICDTVCALNSMFVGAGHTHKSDCFAGLRAQTNALKKILNGSLFQQASHFNSEMHSLININF